MDTEESADAKSRGNQDNEDKTSADHVLLSVLSQRKKITKDQAGYRFVEIGHHDACGKCKFNLGDEMQCHIVEGMVDNKRGISNYYSPKGEGMLPGDIVWEYVKSRSKKLTFSQAHVIGEGARGYRCSDCKFFRQSNSCLIVSGELSPEMSCGFIVKRGHGTDMLL